MPTTDETRFPYQDRTVPVDRRVEDLLARMGPEERAGLLFHTMAGVADPATPNPVFGLPSLESMIVRRRMTHFNLLGSAADGRAFAEWHNAVQRIAQAQPLGIPITFSTDPRHAFTDNPGTAMLAGPFSQWPEPLGLAAIGSPELVHRFADIARREYTAVGLRVALHPQIDLLTEPRWSRGNGTFGEDAELTSTLAAAYVRGFQGDRLGPDSVATMTKHFPGGGPQRDGEDPHFDYGREQVYPGGRFELHLEPFIAAIEAGTSQIMPYYGMPVGTEHEEVGFAFSRSIITDLLRSRLGFTGIVCTDWGLLTDTHMLGGSMPARAWGLEHLTRAERMARALEAGVDQFGGELCTDVLLDLVRSGTVDQARVDRSARLLLREKFVLGLFDERFVDPERAAVVVGAEEFRSVGAAAQRASVTLLTNRTPVDPLLPLGRGIRVYLEGIEPEALTGFADVVTDPSDADVAVLRVKAPYEERGPGFEAFFHAGSLDFPDTEAVRIRAICDSVPTVLDVYLDRPAILTPFVEKAAAITANFGVGDVALLQVLFGEARPEGRLPFDLPSSMAAVEASAEDAPFDTTDPLFRFGHGLRY